MSEAACLNMGFHQDPMMLVQDAQTHRCVIAFAGINNYGTLVAVHSIILEHDQSNENIDC